MEFDLETLSKTPEVLYAGIAAAGLIAGSIVGYIGARVFSGKKLRYAELETQKALGAGETRRAEIELEKAREANRPELKRLEYENAQAEHARKLEVMARENEMEIANENRNAERREKSEAEKRDFKLALAERLCELRPVLEQYAAQVVAYQQTLRDGGVSEIAKKRQEYREQLMEKYLEDNKDNLFDSDYDIAGEDDTARLDNIVAMRYPVNDNPPSKPEMPSELKKLVDMITSE